MGIRGWVRNSGRVAQGPCNWPFRRVEAFRQRASASWRCLSDLFQPERRFTGRGSVDIRQIEMCMS